MCSLFTVQLWDHQGDPLALLEVWCGTFGVLRMKDALQLVQGWPPHREEGIRKWYNTFVPGRFYLVLPSVWKISVSSKWTFTGRTQYRDSDPRKERPCKKMGSWGRGVLARSISHGPWANPCGTPPCLGWLAHLSGITCQEKSLISSCFLCLLLPFSGFECFKCWFSWFDGGFYTNAEYYLVNLTRIDSDFTRWGCCLLS